jgi:hypothetical protein
VPSNDFSMFLDISVASSSSQPIKDELERYLSDPTVQTNNPMKWWYDNRHLYPTLSQMALDYLSVPCAYQPTHLRQDTLLTLDISHVYRC